MTKKRASAGSYIITAISVFLALVFITPIIWALTVSFQVEGQQIVTVWDWFTPPYTISNYVEIIFNSAVPTWFFNSLLIAVATTGGTLFVCALAAYAVSKLEFKGSNAFYMYFLLGIMVPTEATVVPLFITVNGFNMIDTYAGMILPAIAISMNFVILATFFKGLPNELLEAARIDGAGDFTIFMKMILPLSKAIMATVCIMAFIGSWNNYLWPLLCAMGADKFTLPIGIPTFEGTYTVDYVKPLTANMVASLPMIIIYIIFERQIVQGIAMSGVKG